MTLLDRPSPRARLRGHFRRQSTSGGDHRRHFQPQTPPFARRRPHFWTQSAPGVDRYSHSWVFSVPQPKTPAFSAKRPLHLGPPGLGRALGGVVYAPPTSDMH
jgi:hypothetical protein